jgi:hypothetical protein
MDEEAFLPIKGFETKYLASSFGYVLNIRTNKRVVVSVFNNMNIIVRLTDNNITKSISLSRLMIDCFSPHDGTTNKIRHVNGDKSDCKLSNLHKFRQNTGTSLGINTPATSKYVGISLIKGKWTIKLYQYGKSYSLSNLISEEIARKLRTIILDCINSKGKYISKLPRTEQQKTIRKIIKTQLIDYQYNKTN